MEGSFRRPESRMMKPKRAPEPTSQEAESAREVAEFNQEQAARDAKKKDDQVGDMIGGQWFITEWTDPILIHPTLNRQMTVTRFYPQVKIAVDIFTFIDEHERGIIALKRKAFKEQDATYGGEKIKVRYGALSYADPLANLLPQLEE